MEGWIKLHRSLLDWEWYDDIPARLLLIHLLISVNYEDKKWRGQIVKSGSMVLSWDNLTKSCGLTNQQARTAMSKLEKSGEVTRKITNRYQVVSLTKWEKLQGNQQADNKPTNKQTTNKQQTNNKQITTTKEDKEYKNIRSKEYKKGGVGEKNKIPDEFEFVDYGLSQISLIGKDPEMFRYSLQAKYEAWKDNDWKDGHNKPIKNWKTKIKNTIPYLKPIQPIKNNENDKKFKTAGDQLRDIAEKFRNINK